MQKSLTHVRDHGQNRSRPQRLWRSDWLRHGGLAGAPPIDQASYQQEYSQWRQGQQETAAFRLKISASWPLQEGETSFGADPTAGERCCRRRRRPALCVFHENRSAITVTPAAGVALTQGDAGVIKGPAPVERPIRTRVVALRVAPMPPDRVFIMASDEITRRCGRRRRSPPIRSTAAGGDRSIRRVRHAEAGAGAGCARRHDRFPGAWPAGISGRWRGASPAGVRRPDGTIVSCCSRTNDRTTTYGGLRIVTAKAAARGMDGARFNLARNPPCAYSKFTTCPLPPPENRLASPSRPARTASDRDGYAVDAHVNSASRRSTRGDVAGAGPRSRPLNFPPGPPYLVY